MTPTAAKLDPELLDVLVCPLTRSRLRQEGDELIAEVGGLRYPIRDGIPIMLIEEAKLPAGINTLDDFRQKFAAHIPK
ncbi:MAG: Trm112 family protein [Phycisphaeraceae bacterium]|nr:Trm112 family protein [Phycisphaeraceae bacterium]